MSTAHFLSLAGFDVHSFESGDDFLALPTLAGIACILLDMNMPGNDGHAVLLALGERGETAPVIVVTGHGDVAMAVRAMSLGAHDFIEKPYKPAQLKTTVEQAVANSADSLGARDAKTAAQALIAKLSPRQDQVLQYILRGQQNKVIAHELGLSIRTIESYRAQLLRTLGVGGTAGVVRLAALAGMESAQ